MTPARIPLWSVEQYLDFEQHSPDRHEYVGGAVVAMSGGTWAHALVAMNIGGELRARLPQCAVLSSDMKSQIRADDWIAYPDVTVVCGEPRFLAPGKLVLLNPTLVVEVLSPSTRSIDRGAKAEAYRQIPSLRGLLLIEPETVWILHWSRTGDDWTSTVVTDIGATIPLDGFGCELPVRGVYLNVPLPSPESAGSPPAPEPSA